MRTVRFYRMLILLLLVFGVGAVQAAEVWTISAWTNDASTGIDSAETYTHAVNVTNVAGTTTVNGVEFVHEYNANATNWSFNAGNNIPNDTNNMTGNSSAWGVFFHYNGTAFQLSDLTAGQIYELSIFSCGWEDAGRIINLSNGVSSTTFDQDQYGNDNGIRIDSLYQADANGELNLTIPTTFHIYAFANKVYTGEVPIVTTLQSPGNDVIQVDIDAELSWSLALPVENDITFDVYVDPNALKVDSLDPAVRVSSQQPDFSYILDPALEYETTYFWRVVTYVDGEPNEATDVRSFTTDYEVPHWHDAAWTNDADSTISAGKTYTHAVNLNGGVFGAVVANGVPFEGPLGRTGVNWQLDGAPNGTGGGAINIDGSAAALVGGFYYNTPASLTLTGLTPSQEYILTFYTKGWGDAGIRIVRIITSDDGRTVEYDENIDNDGNGHTFSHTYTAPESGELNVEFVQWGAGSWHHYAFSNEVNLPVYLDPSPLPGSKLQAELDLSWQLHGDVVNPSYNLYLSTDSNIQDLLIAGLDQPTYHVSLDPEVNYYWKVEVVEDGGPVVYESPVWDFLTSPPPDALKVLEWKMDETVGPIAYQTGTSEDADGLLSGFNDPNLGAFVPGLVGNGLLLNGTSEYVDISDAYPFMPTGDEQAFAVSVYFRTFKAYGPIFSMRNEANGTPLIDITIGHDGARESAGRVRLLVRDDAGVLGPDANSGILVNDGRWHSLVVMRAAGNWKMYVDGIKRAEMSGVASGAVTLNWLAIGASKMWIFDSHGSWSWQNTHIRYFKGIIDEVCVWSGEMQPGQIEAHAAIVPPAGDMDFDLDTDEVDLEVVANNWLVDSYTPVQPSPLVLEDMESYTASDPNTYAPYWEALEGVSLESVGGNVDTAPAVGLSLNSIQIDAQHGQVLQWEYDFEGQSNVMERFWLRDRRVDLGLYDQISIRVKKLPNSTGDQLYFDFHDGRGITDPENFGVLAWNLAWKSRVILPLADLPEDQWVTLTANIPAELSGRPRELNDFYELSIGISMGASGTTGTMLIDEITLTDGTDDCFPEVGTLLPDMNGDCLVNIQDSAIMAGGWRQGL